VRCTIGILNKAEILRRLKTSGRLFD